MSTELILAIGGLVTIIGAQIVLIIQALKANAKIDQAAVRREEIVETITNAGGSTTNTGV